CGAGASRGDVILRGSVAKVCIERGVNKLPVVTRGGIVGVTREAHAGAEVDGVWALAEDRGVQQLEAVLGVAIDTHAVSAASEGALNGDGGIDVLCDLAIACVGVLQAGFVDGVVGEDL